MYGDERHISVLRAELESNDIEYYHDAVEGARQRYSKEMDGSKDFVKLLVNNEGRKLRNHPKILEKSKTVEKLQKSIDEKSNNVLFQNNLKNSEGDFKSSSLLNNYSNKSFIKTTTTSRTTTAETTTKQETSTFSAINSTTTQEPNVTTVLPPTITIADVTTETTSKVDLLNVTRTTALPNDTQIEEETDYKTETEKTEENFTTTGSEGLTTTDEIDFDDEEIPTEQDDGYDDTMEEVEIEEQEVIEEPVSQQPPPLIRLKGM